MADQEELGIIELEANLADVEKPLELPPGMYTGEIQDIQVMDSAKGNKYFAIKFIIPAEEIAADMQDQFEDGAVLFWNRQIVPTGKDRRALFNLRKFIEAIGLDANTTSIDPNEWMGCTAKLKVRQTRYQGELRAEIASVDAADDAPVTPRGKRPAIAEEEPAPTRGRAPARGKSRK